MKKLISLVIAAGLSVAFVAPGVTAEKAPTTKAACEKAKMSWDDATKKDKGQHVAFAKLLPNPGVGFGRRPFCCRLASCLYQRRPR